MKKTLSKIAILLFINSQFLVHNSAFSQNISINGTGATAHPSAILDVSSPNMGLLIPRLPLVAINNPLPITSPTISLLLYNTATASTGTNAVSPGYYYWDGAKWVNFLTNVKEPWFNVATNTEATANSQDIYQMGKVGIGRLPDAFSSHSLQVNSQKLGTHWDGTNQHYSIAQGPSAFSGSASQFPYTLIGGNSFLDRSEVLIGGSTNMSNESSVQNIIFYTHPTKNTALGSERMRIDRNGNVGIGTANPANKLEITQGSAGNSGLRFTNLPNAAVLKTDANGDVVPTTASTATNNGVFWGLNGNAGTNPTTNFLGTTDNQDLIFRSNNQQSGLINQSLGATSFGYRALSTANTGSDNSAFGNFSLFANTSGFRNSAFGYNSMIANNTGSNNSSFGAYALQANTAGSRNTAVGVSALTANTLANDNTAIGFVSLSNNTTGSQNVSIGAQSSYSNTTGQQNVAVGYSALSNNITGSYNTALGQEALFNNNAAQNVAVGYYSLRANTTGSLNVAVGASALSANTTGFQNVAVGNQALNSNTSGLINTALGNAALRSNTTGFSNVGVGNAALNLNTNGTNNTAIGTSAGQLNTTGSNNAFLGFQSGYGNTIGINNTYIGTSAGYSNTIGSSNVAVGKDALFSNTTSSLNIAIGVSSLFSNTTGNLNVAVGFEALQNNTIAENNVAMGVRALRTNSTGSLNVAVGNSALRLNTTGIQNTAIGQDALYSNTSSFNTAVGSYALFQNTTGTFNTALGRAALIANTTGSANVAVGFSTLNSNASGSGNTVMGYAALNNLTTGIENIAIGVQAGATNSLIISGSYNTLVGSYADVTGTYTNAAAIGYQARVGGDNMMVLGGTGSRAVNVGIGTTTPTEKLDIVGSIKIVDGTQGAGRVLTSDATGKATWQVSSGSLLSTQNIPMQSIPPTATTPLAGFLFSALSASDYRVEYRNWCTFTGGTVGADIAFHVRVLKNGTPVDEFEHYAVLGPTRNVTFNVILHVPNCNVGDNITIDLRPGIPSGATSIDFNVSNPWTTSKVLVFPE